MYLKDIVFYDIASAKEEVAKRKKEHPLMLHNVTFDRKNANLRISSHFKLLYRKRIKYGFLNRTNQY